jgi:hypothetical protein
VSLKQVMMLSLILPCFIFFNPIFDNFSVFCIFF